MREYRVKVYPKTWGAEVCVEEKFDDEWRTAHRNDRVLMGHLVDKVYKNPFNHQHQYPWPFYERLKDAVNWGYKHKARLEALDRQAKDD